ncbi:MAG: hypothetical protein JNL10_21350 [Verrucomicrobiales bacterium]|nr:hypothetical protein [Verrucomicrobiales bacterium]
MSPSRHSFIGRFETGASLVPPFALAWVAARAGWIPVEPRWCLTLMGIAFGVGMLAPQPFQGWRQRLHAVQSWIGRKIVRQLLALIFLLIVVPVGLLLRLRRTSFLEHSAPDSTSFWLPARPPGSLRDPF